MGQGKEEEHKLTLKRVYDIVIGQVCGYILENIGNLAVFTLIYYIQRPKGQYHFVIYELGDINEVIFYLIEKWL